MGLSEGNEKYREGAKVKLSDQRKAVLVGTERVQLERRTEGRKCGRFRGRT